MNRGVLHLQRGLLVALAILLALALVEVVLLYHHIYQYAPVNNDAGYYLGSVERMTEGFVLYRDLAVGYTPLGLLAFYGARVAVGPEITYSGYLTVLILVHALNAGLVFLLARRLGSDVLVSTGAAVLTLLLNYGSEGYFVALEPFVAFFALLAALAVLQAKGRTLFLFLAGAAAGAAFLSKQYGLVVLGPVGLVALAQGRGLLVRLGNGFWVLAGFLTPLVLLFGVFAFAFDTAPSVVYGSWFGEGYAWWGVAKALPVLIDLVLSALVVLVWLPFLPLERATRRSQGFWLVLLLAFVMLLPLLVRNYMHYLLLTIPFLSVLAASITTWGLRRGPLLKTLVLITAVATLILGARDAHRDFRWIRKQWDRGNQERVAQAVNKVVPRGSSAQVISDLEQWLLYLADITPPRPRELGYKFPLIMTDAEMRHALAATPFAVVSEQALEDEPRWRPLLEEAGFVEGEPPIEGYRIFRARR